MERSLALAGSPSRPVCFSHVPAHARSPIPISTVSFRRSSMLVRARHTLSSNWDVQAVKKASPLPRFEELDTSSMLLRQRIIFLASSVDDMTADLVIGQLLFLDADDPTKDIRLFINSPGGAVTAAFAVYDAIKMCKADVSTVCMGLAASMSAFILAGGTKGKRFCIPNARVMIRQPYGYGGGTSIEAAIRAREANHHRIRVMKTLAWITGKTEKQIESDFMSENFLSAWEAKEYGLVDEVIDDGKPGLVAPISESVDPPERRIPGLWKCGCIFDEPPSEHTLLKKE